MGKGPEIETGQLCTVPCPEATPGGTSPFPTILRILVISVFFFLSPSFLSSLPSFEQR